MLSFLPTYTHTHTDHKRVFGGDGYVYYIDIVVIILLMYAYVQINQIMSIKYVHFLVYWLYLNKIVKKRVMKYFPNWSLFHSCFFRANFSPGLQKTIVTKIITFLAPLLKLSNSFPLYCHWIVRSLPSRLEVFFLLLEHSILTDLHICCMLYFPSRTPHHLLIQVFVLLLLLSVYCLWPPCITQHHLLYVTSLCWSLFLHSVCHSQKLPCLFTHLFSICSFPSHCSCHIIDTE